MAYDLRYANDSAEQIGKYSVQLQGRILEKLEELADDPISASNPPSSPLWPARQLFVFRLDDESGRTWVFNVIWRYDEDETTLNILAVAGYIAMPVDEGEEPD